MSDTWEFYKDADNQWHWRRRAPDGNTVGASTESYTNKADCDEDALCNGWIVQSSIFPHAFYQKEEIQTWK